MKREMWPDVYRGIAIIAVVLIHSSSHMLSQLSPCGWSWFGMAAINRLLQFAVPAFLMVSAYLNASGVDGTLLGAGRFLLRRARALLIPYLLASLVGLEASTRFNLASITVRHLCKMLLLGQCYYHLYFIVLVFQLYAAIPILVHIMRRPRPLWVVIAAASAIQLGAYTINRLYIQSQEVGSCLFWYMLPVGLGLWLTLSRGSCESLLVRGRSILFWTTLISAAAYFPLATLALVQPVNTFACQALSWIFTAAAALGLASISIGIAGSKIGLGLASLGRSSLTIYLAHPFVIVLLDHIIPTFQQEHPWPALFLYAAISLFATSFLAGKLRMPVPNEKARAEQASLPTSNLATLKAGERLH